MAGARGGMSRVNNHRRVCPTVLKILLFAKGPKPQPIGRLANTRHQVYYIVLYINIVAYVYYYYYIYIECYSELSAQNA